MSFHFPVDRGVERCELYESKWDCRNKRERESESERERERDRAKGMNERKSNGFLLF